MQRQRLPPSPPDTAALAPALADLHFAERSTLAVRAFGDASETGTTVTLDARCVGCTLRPAQVAHASPSAPRSVFNAPLRTDIVHRVIRWQLAQGRDKEYGAQQRGEARGSTRKVQPQKGQGRARQGMRLVPGRYGGPKAHPPRARSWRFALPRKVRQLALRVVLSAKAAEGRLHVVDALQPASHKTGQLVSTLDAWGIAGEVGLEGRAVFVDGGAVHPNLALAARGVGALDAVSAAAFTPLHVLRHPHVFVTPEALEALTARLGQ